MNPLGGKLAKGAVENDSDTATSSGASTNTITSPVMP